MRHHPSVDILSSRSAMLTIGIAVQVHTVERETLALCQDRGELQRHFAAGPFSSSLRRLDGAGLIEIDSQQHRQIADLREEMKDLRRYLCELAGSQGQMVSGGTYPLTKGARLKMQIRIGCPDGDLAKLLCQAWPRYLPQLIALSAASPFHAGRDTQFASFRPQGLADHAELDSRPTDIHYDIARKLIEIRVCDTPLKLDTAVDLAAYAKEITRYLLAEVPAPRDDEAAFDYRQACFQAAQFSFDGQLGCHDDGKTIAKDILATLEQLREFGTGGHLDELNRIEQQVHTTANDSQALRAYLSKDRNMTAIVARQVLIWASARQPDMTERTPSANENGPHEAGHF